MMNRIRALRDRISPYEPHPADFAYRQIEVNPWHADPAQYVDFSTDYPKELQPLRCSAFIGDLSWTVTRYSSMNQMLAIYRKFPIHEIIAMLLSVSLDRCDTPEYEEFLMFETEEHLGPDLFCHVDTEELATFYELLTNELDYELTIKVPGYFHDRNFVFRKWIDPVSACMSRDISPSFGELWVPSYVNHHPS